jgi:imidazole glycerol-phosphate synthase subunit HisF
MLAKRIVPCLDVMNGRTVKGVNFENIRDMGDPVELAAYYATQGADELVFLDITATNEQRKTVADWVLRTAAELNIPFTVGGGINSVADVEVLLAAGADKISVNSSAVRRPELLKELSFAFGSQCIVLAIDTRQEEDGIWYVYTNGGRVKTNMLTLDWIAQANDLGIGEILLTSINHDGTKQGFANELLATVSRHTHVPVIASGGAGNAQHFADVFMQGQADAALAAGIFHNKTLQIPDLKDFLQSQGIVVRR